MRDNARKCWICGAQATRALRPNNTVLIAPELGLQEEIRTSRQFCEKCYEEHSRKIVDLEEEYGRLKKKLMLERAIRTLEKQHIDLYTIKDIIDQMGEYVEENPQKFDSAPEMIAAIMLIANGFKIKAQYKIDTYTVDFLIPGLKVVLEVDGYLHKFKVSSDSIRDIKIRSILGDDWEVVRIPVKYIEANAKQLVAAILSMKAEKQKIRRENNGVIPGWYSGRK